MREFLTILIIYLVIFYLFDDIIWIERLVNKDQKQNVNLRIGNI